MARANLSVPARAAGGEEFVACAVDGGTLPFQVDADVAADQCLVELYLGSGISPRSQYGWNRGMKHSITQQVLRQCPGPSLSVVLPKLAGAV